MTKHKTGIGFLKTFIALFLVLSVFCNIAFSSALVKLTSITSSDYYLTDFYKLDILSEDTLQISGRNSNTNIDKYWFYIRDYKEQTGEMGRIDTETREYASHLDLSSLDSDTYYAYMFFSEIGSNSYTGTLLPYPIIVSEDEIYIEATDSTPINDRFSMMLSALSPNDYLGTDGICNTQAELDEIKNKALEITADATSDYERILKIHDWVADNIYYDWISYNDGSWASNHEKQRPYFVFSNKYAVCQGYAELAELMLRCVDIPSIWVSGYADGAGAVSGDINKANHAWNAAFTDDRWVIFDSTWNSTNKRILDEDNITPVKDKGDIKHTYFDPSIEAFSYDHRLLGIDYIVFDDYILEYENGEHTVKDYIGDDESTIIPYSFGGAPVTGINNGAFDDETLIKIYNIDGTLKDVEEGPLKNIIVPNNITVIDKNVFTYIYYTGGDLYPLNTTITANVGTAAESFAETHDMNFIEAEVVDSVSLNKTKLTLEPSEYDFLYVQTGPTQSVFKTISFVSSNLEVAEVSNDGVITANKAGTVDIAVTADGITSICNVTVEDYNRVIDLINALPTEIALSDLEIIAVAKSAYDNLPKEQQAKVTNIEKLNSAVQKINELTDNEQNNTASANYVISLIDEINDEVTLEIADEVSAAKTAYDLLTPAQRLLITNYDKLNNALIKISELNEYLNNKNAANTVIALIDAIGDEITLEGSDEISAAKAAYNLLTPVQKELVTNVDVLNDAQEKIDELLSNEIDQEKANEVIALIDSIPNEITSDSSGIIETAREEYEILSDVQKNMVNNLHILIEAEIKLDKITTGYILGDIDLNGQLTVSDIVSLRAIIMGDKTLTNEKHIAAANVDGQGGLTVGDIVALRKLIMK